MAKKEMNKDSKKFGKELKSELKKVTWPTFKELVSSTSAVISIVIIVAAIVFVLDLCFENVNKFGVEKLKTLVTSDTEETQDEATESDEISENTTSIDVTSTEEDEITADNIEIDSEGVSEENTDVTTDTEENQ